MQNKTEVPEIKKAVVFLREMSADEKMQEQIRVREKRLHDEASMIVNAKQEERQKTIERLRQLGYSEEKIKEIYNF